MCDVVKIPENMADIERIRLVSKMTKMLIIKNFGRILIDFSIYY